MSQMDIAKKKAEIQKRFDFQQSHLVQMMSFVQQSKEEYDSLVQDYYLLRVQHQTEMLRLNQVLYLNSQRPSGVTTPQELPMDTSGEAPRPVLAGICTNTSMQIDAQPTFSRKRELSESEDWENKKCRDQY